MKFLVGLVKFNQQILKYIVIAMFALLTACSLDIETEDTNSVTLPVNSSSLATYPQDNSDADLPLTDYYEVSVHQGDISENLIVYMSKSNGASEGGRNASVVDDTISWTQFSFKDEVTIRVKLKPAQSKVFYDTAKVLPSRHKVTTTKIDDSTLEFKLTKPGQYSVEFGEKGYKNGLLIFADPMETDVPDKNAANVMVCDPCHQVDLTSIDVSYDTVYFTPKSHTIMNWYPQGHIKNIYLEGGAVVKGSIHFQDANNNGSRIWGRGHLDGRVFGGGKSDDTKFNMVESLGGVTGVRVEGLVISQPSKFAVRLLGKNNEIHWVKTPGGWRFNNDGLVGYENTHISNSFVWANDDGIKLYRDNQNIENIVAWHLTNGAVFQWAWNTVDAKNIRVKNVDVLHGEWPVDGANQGVFNIRASTDNNGLKTQEDFIFENITVENDVAIFINLAPKHVDHIVKNITFKNISFKGDGAIINRVKGYSSNAKLSDIQFENLQLNGECLNDTTAISKANFEIANAENVSFTCP